ncbi:MAG: 1-deoxy-D-xylulose-5-phosphate reductoisomerase [Pseudomonadota bacterium]
MARRPIAILGSTGSIGTTALGVASKYPDRFEVISLAVGENVERAVDQVRKFRPKLVSTRTEEGMRKLREATSTVTGVEYTFGVEGAERVATHPNVHTVLSAIVGAAGLRPTVAAIQAGKTIALANKESMVVAGALVSRLAREKGVRILPVDSEHSAVFQSMAGAEPSSIRRLILTASGGPFFLKKGLDLSKVTRTEALAHPNWQMGEKITIDSATLMNKGLEVIEAHWLFGFPPSKIDVVVHPQSVIHSMVEYIDGSVVAQLGVPDMAGPIALALAYPDRLDGVMERVPFTKLKELTFFEPDHGRFPAIRLARTALESGETHPAVLNGANEVTVRGFLDGKIGFLEISRINGDVLSSYRQKRAVTLEDYIAADEWGRARATEIISKA